MNHYYEPPHDISFEDMKSCAIKLWKSIATEPHEQDYLNEKLSRIEKLENVGDNFMYILAMFDIRNQIFMNQLLTADTIIDVNSRLKAGGTPDYLLMIEK